MTDPRAAEVFPAGQHAPRPHVVPQVHAGPGPNAPARVPRAVAIHCGWGRLLFGQTFDTSADVARTFAAERPGERDIAMYVRDPQVVLACAPEALFLDPSHTFRKTLDPTRPHATSVTGYRVCALTSAWQADQVAALYRKRRLVPVSSACLLAARTDARRVQLVAQDLATGDVIGTATGVDHVEAFDDPERGCSLWALTVDAQTPHAGVGHALVTALLDRFAALGRRQLDLSVLHDNQQAISLYEKLGFERIPVFCLKRRNSYNEPLYTAHPEERSLTPETLAIAREARRRGILVDVLDEQSALVSLSRGGRTMVCQESLSELTSAIALSRCLDARVWRRMLRASGLRTPEPIVARTREESEAFLAAHGTLFVQPARRERCFWARTAVQSRDALARALCDAHGAPMLLEPAMHGERIRALVIDHRVVAAALLRPPCIVGDGVNSVRALIEKQTRRRANAAGGGAIPLDLETLEAVRETGHSLDEVLEAGVAITVRRTADVHAGGTSHDLTYALHPKLASLARRAAELLDLPVAGIDLLVPRLLEPEAWVVGVDEQPALLLHEPQPTVARYLDLLFPQTASPHADAADRPREEHRQDPAFLSCGR